MLFINKPAGPTSHDIVDVVRKMTGERRVGHAGTLDPFATGLLIILVGKDETRTQSHFLGMNKEYEATIRFGAASTTEDRTGTISETPCVPFSKDDLVKTLASFVGSYEQMPSAHSAKKINGVRAYTLAWQGKIPALVPKMITIYSMELLAFEWPTATIRTTVSSGTYIRALARDIGEKLGSGAYLEELCRTSIGPYRIENALTLEEIKKMPCENRKT